jgi:hypothetical protein
MEPPIRRWKAAVGVAVVTAATLWGAAHGCDVDAALGGDSQWDAVINALDKPSTGKYSRPQFGPGLSSFDADRNGCTERDDALRRGVNEPGEYVRSGDHDGCPVTAAYLRDPYTGKWLPKGDLEAEHVIPLKWAWVHGADRWPRSRRIQFATDHANVVMASEHENASKGGKGPAGYMPDSDPCQYARWWVTVAHRYDLQLPASDAQVLQRACSTGRRRKVKRDKACSWHSDE